MPEPIPLTVEEYVAAVVAAAPPLTPDQYDRLSVLLRPPPERKGRAA